MTKEDIILPEWFKAETGFSFVDNEHELYVILGVGSFSHFRMKGVISFSDNKTERIDMYSPERTERDLIAVRVNETGLFSFVNILNVEDGYDQLFWNTCLPYTKPEGSLLESRNTSDFSAWFRPPNS